MPHSTKTYIAIDLKSFYASVECVERGLDALRTNLVVADASRTDKTICLAVSPSLKSYGIGGRARLFEVVQRVRQVNYQRMSLAPGRRLTAKSYDKPSLDADPSLALDYIVAPPRMAHYLKMSAKIYEIYLRYISSEDIHVYSVDEVFIDATDYLRLYNLSAHDLAMKLIREVLAETGITATAGIGSNLFLCKIAMDIKAKKMAPDKDGVRIAELDESSYRRELWNHRPLTDFWRVGRGIADKLKPYGIETMGDIARLSLKNEDFFFHLFGVNAELLLDHAWGYEPVTIDLIKAYRPESHSSGCGQVLTCPYTVERARVVIHEMADECAFELVAKHLVADQVVVDVGYDIESLTDPKIATDYTGKVSIDRYGRRVPAPSHGSANLGCSSSSAKLIGEKVLEVFDRIVNPSLLVRRLNVCLNHVVPEGRAEVRKAPLQLDLFTDYEALARQQAQDREQREKERRLQETMLHIKETFGKNAILKGLNFADGATQRQRNQQIGGHHE